MWVGFILELAVSILFFYFGYLIKNKQKINLIHQYHHNNLKPEDINAYTYQMGMSLYIIAFSIMLSAGFTLFSLSPFNSIVAVAGIILAFFKMHKAQMKYNGSWFS